MSSRARRNLEEEMQRLTFSGAGVSPTRVDHQIRAMEQSNSAMTSRLSLLEGTVQTQQGLLEDGFSQLRCARAENRDLQAKLLTRTQDHTSQIQILAQQNENLRNVHEAQISHVRQEHAGQIQQLNQQKQRELTELQTSLTQTYSQEKQALQSQHQAALEAAHRQHQAALETTQRQADMTKQRELFEQAGRAKQEKDDATQHLTQKYELALQQKQQEHDTQMATLKGSLENIQATLRKKEQDFAEQLGASQREITSRDQSLARLKADLANKQSAIDQLMRTTESQSQEITDMKAETQRNIRYFLEEQLVQQTDKRLNELRSEHEIRTQEALAQWESEKFGLTALIEQLQESLGTANERYENRGSLPQDVEQIQDLETRLHQTEQQNAQLEEQIAELSTKIETQHDLSNFMFMPHTDGMYPTAQQYGDYNPMNFPGDMHQANHYGEDMRTMNRDGGDVSTYQQNDHQMSHAISMAPGFPATTPERNQMGCTRMQLDPNLVSAPMTVTTQSGSQVRQVTSAQDAHYGQQDATGQHQRHGIHQSPEKQTTFEDQQAFKEQQVSDEQQTFRRQQTFEEQQASNERQSSELGRSKTQSAFKEVKPRSTERSEQTDTSKQQTHSVEVEQKSEEKKSWIAGLPTTAEKKLRQQEAKLQQNITELEAERDSFRATLETMNDERRTTTEEFQEKLENLTAMLESQEATRLEEKEQLEQKLLEQERIQQHQTAEVTRLTSTVKQKDQNFQALNQKIEALEEQKKIGQQAMTQLKALKCQLETEQSSGKQAKLELEQSLAHHHAAQQMQTEQISALTERATRNEEERANLNQKLIALKHEKTTNAQLNDKLSKLTSQLEAEKVSRQHEIRQTEQSLAKTKTELNTLHKRHRQMEETLKTNEADKAQLQANMETELDTLHNINRQMEENLEGYEADKVQLQNQLDELKRCEESLKSTLDEKEMVLGELRAENTELQEELDKKKMLSVTRIEDGSEPCHEEATHGDASEPTSPRDSNNDDSTTDLYHSNAADTLTPTIDETTAGLNESKSGAAALTTEETTDKANSTCGEAPTKESIDLEPDVPETSTDLDHLNTDTAMSPTIDETAAGLNESKSGSAALATEETTDKANSNGEEAPTRKSIDHEPDVPESSTDLDNFNTDAAMPPTIDEITEGNNLNGDGALSTTEETADQTHSNGDAVPAIENMDREPDVPLTEPDAKLNLKRASSEESDNPGVESAVQPEPDDEVKQLNATLCTEGDVKPHDTDDSNGETNTSYNDDDENTSHTETPLPIEEKFEHKPEAPCTPGRDHEHQNVNPKVPEREVSVSQSREEDTLAESHESDTKQSTLLKERCKTIDDTLDDTPDIPLNPISANENVDGETQSAEDTSADIKRIESDSGRRDSDSTASLSATTKVSENPDEDKERTPPVTNKGHSISKKNVTEEVKLNMPSAKAYSENSPAGIIDEGTSVQVTSTEKSTNTPSSMPNQKIENPDNIESTDVSPKTSDETGPSHEVEEPASNERSPSPKEHMGLEKADDEDVKHMSGSTHEKTQTDDEESTSRKIHDVGKSDGYEQREDVVASNHDVEPSFSSENRNNEPAERGPVSIVNDNGGKKMPNAEKPTSLENDERSTHGHLDSLDNDTGEIKTGPNEATSSTTSRETSPDALGIQTGNNVSGGAESKQQPAAQPPNESTVNENKTHSQSGRDKSQNGAEGRQATQSAGKQEGNNGKSEPKQNQTGATGTNQNTPKGKPWDNNKNRGKGNGRKKRK